MNVFFASSSDISIPIAKALATQDLIKGFITSPDRPRGRSRHIGANDFALWADDLNVPIFKPNDQVELIHLLETQRVDLVITCSYGHLIRKDALIIPKLGWLNIHFSLLPKYRGAAPVQRAIQSNENRTGITIFKLDEGVDTGPILYSSEYLIKGNLGAKNILADLANLAAIALPKLLNDVDSWQFAEQQGEPTYAPKIVKEENRIDFKSSAEEIKSNLRALEINGGVYCLFRGEKLQLLILESCEFYLPPGEIKVEGSQLFVGTGSTALRVEQVKFSGKREMHSSEWLNGIRLIPGEKFE